MYVIKRLKSIFPNYKKDLDDFDIFLKKCSKNAEIIFDSDKNNFHWLIEAFLYGPGNIKYTKAMAFYEMSINFDKDFLTENIDIDTSNMTVDEMRRYLFKENYDLDYERKTKKKLKIMDN